MRCWIGWHRWTICVLDPSQPPFLDWVFRCTRCLRTEAAE